jgi:hypothetical protein
MPVHIRARQAVVCGIHGNCGVFVAAELGSVQERVYVCDAGGCSIVLEAAAVGHCFLQGWAGLRGLFVSAACS